MKNPSLSIPRSTFAAYLAAPPLVAVTTYLLRQAQISLATVTPQGEIILPRPFSTIFILLAGLLTLWAGWGPGLFCLCMAFVVVLGFLLPREGGLSTLTAMDWAALGVTLAGGLIVIGAVETARRAQVRSSQLLSESENARARLRAITDAAPVGVLTCDAQGVLEYANPETERIWGQPLVRVGIDGYARYKILNIDGTPRPPEKRGLARALTREIGVLSDDMITEQPDGSRVRILARSTRIVGENDATLGAVTVLQDTTEQHKAQEALRRSEERYRSLVDATAQFVWTNTPEGEMRGEQPGWAELSGQTQPEYQGYGWADAVHPDDAKPTITAWQISVETRTPFMFEHRVRRFDGAYRWYSIRAVPVIDENDQIVEWVGIHTDITERKQAEAERAQRLSDAQKQAEQESLLNRIGQVQRTTDDPVAVQKAAVSALGEALRADRCYFTIYDTAKRVISVFDDWHISGLPSGAGDYRATDFMADMETFFAEDTPFVVSDVRADARLDKLVDAYAAGGVAAFIAVPLFDEGKLIAALNITQTVPRLWTDDEVELVARTAAQTRTATELALLRQRDHNIAERLENALRPSLPDAVPGFDLGYHYQAALAESSIGGDFFDVFLLQNRVAFVIGDLSGKGLAAASQIATVRNMLRFAVYQAASIGEALTQVNDAIVEHNLLTGFATLFVGIYDSDTQTLSYGSCGHEPVILRRATTHHCDLLEATGPVMGGFPGAVFDEGHVRLVPGDTLVLYTDGLSEAGRSRHDFLTTEGLVRLVEVIDAPTAPGLVRALINGVSAHAHHTFHDDQCLLVATLLPSPEKIPA